MLLRKKLATNCARENFIFDKLPVLTPKNAPARNDPKAFLTTLRMPYAF